MPITCLRILGLSFYIKNKMNNCINCNHIGVIETNDKSYQFFVFQEERTATNIREIRQW